MSAFISKMFSSFVGNTTTATEGETVAESSSTTAARLCAANAAAVSIQQNTEEVQQPKPSKRRRTMIIEEEKKWVEMQHALENSVLEWKKSLDLGYEFDHIEKWPYSPGDDDGFDNKVALPSDHLSTKAMYE
jgi:hypothetical protein